MFNDLNPWAAFLTVGLLLAGLIAVSIFLWQRVTMLEKKVATLSGTVEAHSTVLTRAHTNEPNLFVPHQRPRPNTLGAFGYTRPPQPPQPYYWDGGEDYDL